MATANNTVEIEVDGGNNQSLYLLGKELRGRWDWTRDRDPAAAVFFRDPPIPGQALGLELDSGRLYRRELLHDEEHSAAREKIERRFAIPAQLEEYGATHVPTAVHWMKSAVASGNARVIKGQLPDKLDPSLGEPKLVPPKKGDEKIDALTDAVAQMSTMLGKVLSALVSKK